MDKMLADGYFDMSVYINARIHKDDMLAKLKKKNQNILFYIKTHIQNQKTHIILERKVIG